MIILSQLISTLCDKLKQKKIAKLNEASCPDDKSLLAAGWYIVRASVMLAATTQARLWLSKLGVDTSIGWA